ncbi:MAG: 2-isopropylmalate synthase [Ferrimicrobium sp.]
MDERVVIFDTTLRDGEQSPGISLDVLEKLEIAEQLARVKVDYIEAGFPVASQGDFDAVQAIARQVHGPSICALSRTHLSDVDRCWEALRDAERARIHVFISTSPSHLAHMLKMDEAQVLAEVKSSVTRARDHTDDVEFSPQDATRTPLPFLYEVLATAVAAGATTLNIADTVGYAIPWDFGEMITRIRAEVSGEYVISCHCHNDLGLASANTLAAIAAGARQVEVCVNGIGERAGNAALEEIVMALQVRSDIFKGLSTGVRTEELARASRLVSRLTGYPVQYNKSVVGRNAFAHESGIHQHGVLTDRSTYEVIDASSVGRQGSEIVLGKHSGRHAFTASLEAIGVTLTGDSLNAAFARFKELADRKVSISEADLEAIVAEEIGLAVGDRFELVGIEVSASTGEMANATVEIVDGSDRRSATAAGNGMVDAVGRAIGEATGIDAKLTGFLVSSVTGGVDALGDVVVKLVAGGVEVAGRGVSTDIIEASARAYVNALNRVSRAREKASNKETP